MNESNLERYRSAWRGERNFGRQPLGPEDIEAVLKKESKNITRQFRAGLVVDMVLKGLAAAALAVLLYLFRDNAVLGWMNAAVLLLTLFLVYFQWRTLQRIPRPEAAGDSLRGCLQSMVRFYRERYVRALYAAAATASLVFYVGVLFYSKARYGGIRPMDAEDWIVFISGLLLAFAVNAAAQRWQAAFQLRELEQCLREIDADTLSEQKLRRRRFRRIRVVLMWTIWLVLGILVLAWLFAR